MNAEQLTAIKERAEKATPGPWESKFVGLNKTQYSVLISELGYIAHIYAESDAEFIVAARQDVPALVTENERLRKALTRITEHRVNHFSTHARMVESMFETAKDALK